MMNGYNFTERVRKLLAHARSDAMRRGNTEVQPEHIALGLLAEDDGVAYAVMRDLRVPVDEAQRDLDAQLPAYLPNAPRAADLPFTPPAKRVLEHAMEEARVLKHPYVGTEHLLLALLREDSGSPCAIFARHDFTHEKALAQTLRLLGTLRRG
jgi:ATP-dependent Clp protease ATP-binding subunit ClpC